VIALDKVSVRPCTDGGICSECHPCVEIFEFSDSVHITFCRRFSGLKQLISVLDSEKRLDLALKS
jgi:hypothetical protein